MIAIPAATRPTATAARPTLAEGVGRRRPRRSSMSQPAPTTTAMTISATAAVRPCETASLPRAPAVSACRDATTATAAATPTAETVAAAATGQRRGAAASSTSTPTAAVATAPRDEVK